MNSSRWISTGRIARSFHLPTQVSERLFDNFASFAGDYTSLGASGLFSTNVSATNPPGALYFLTDSTSTTGTNIVLNLSGTSFQNLSAISFRLCGWNSEAAAASGTGQLQLNYGTLVANAPLALANGLVIGGRSAYFEIGSLIPPAPRSASDRHCSPPTANTPRLVRRQAPTGGPLA